MIYRFNDHSSYIDFLLCEVVVHSRQGSFTSGRLLVDDIQFLQEWPSPPFTGRRGWKSAVVEHHLPKILHRRQTIPTLYTSWLLDRVLSLRISVHLKELTFEGSLWIVGVPLQDEDEPILLQDTLHVFVDFLHIYKLYNGFQLLGARYVLLIEFRCGRRGIDSGYLRPSREILRQCHSDGELHVPYDDEG